MEKNTNLESMKKKLIDYGKKAGFSQMDIHTIEECDYEKRLRYCLEILEENGELIPNQMYYLLLTD